MTTNPGDPDEDRDGAPPATGTLPRRRLLVAALGTAAGGAAALAARPSPAQAAAVVLTDPRGVGGDARAGGPDVVGDWFDHVIASFPASAHPGSGVADRLLAVSWVSALGALDAGGVHPTQPRRRAGYEAAAVATAVHDALVELVPEQAGRLDAALAASLAAIPDGEAKQAGIRAGQHAAARTLADRQVDGLDPASLNPPFAPPPEAPGVYRLPPGAPATHGAGWHRVRPFLLDRADRFRPGPPPALGSDRYRRDLQEVHRLGGATSERTEVQSDIAWLAPSMQYLPALRALVRGAGRPVAWKVRLLAAYAAVTVDAQIATGDAKFTYMLWRPVTAIRSADTDGDPRTDPDPAWASYLPTPGSPEYPSGHAVLAGAAERVLAHFTGPSTPTSFTATWHRGDGKVVSREYRRGTRWSTLTQENVDARVWAGVHFRFSDETGATLGRRVADDGIRRLEQG